MIETVVRAHLVENLSVPVYMETPPKPPETYVLAEKTGGSMENRQKSAMITVQSYAPRLLAAAELNEAVKTAMESLAEREEIASCRLNSDYNFTNTASKGYRYQAVFDIYHY